MATIPTYQRQVMPGSADMQVARANTNQSGESPIANALQNIGQQGMAIAGGMIREQIAEKKKETEDRAAVDVANVLSQGDVYWQEYVVNSTKNWKVGDADLREQVGKDFDKWREENAAKLPTDASRKYFQQHAAGMKARLQTGVYSYQEKATDAKLDADTNVGIQADENVVYAEPHRFDEIYKRRMETVIARPGMTEAKKIEFADKYKKALTFSVERGQLERDPQAWYRERFGEYKKPGTKPATPSAAAAPVGGDVISTASGEVPAALWQAQINQESGGKQFKDGKPITSSAGAVGIAQVMPGTAREAAALAGLPYDERRYREDAGYNEALGQAYMAKQLQQFGGDQAKALAAYNAGPGRVESLVKKHGENWLQHAPAETQNYVKSIMAKATKAPGVQVASLDTGTVSDAGSGAAPVAPAAPTPPSTFTSMDWEKQLQLKTHAETMIRQQSALMHAEMDQKLRDASAMHTDGKPDPFNLTAADFTTAYGAEGAAKYAEYQASRVMAQDIGSFKTMSPDEIAASLKSSQSDVEALAAQGGTGYATADARQNTRMTAAKHVLEMQQKDPQAYAASVGLSNAKPLDFGNLEAFGREIAGRTATASMMRDKYKTPYTLLTNQEASQMAQVMAKFPAAARVDYLNTIRRSVQDPAAYRSVIAQIAPDSPVTAVAGSILAKDAPMNVPGGWFNSDVTMSPKAVATTILQGEAILNPAGSEKKQDGRGGNFPMPKNTDMETEFAAYVGNAFRGDPTGYSAAFQAYRAYYAGKASEKGILAPDLDSKISKEALNAVTGGVTDFNGNGQVLKPWGMSDGDFESTVRTEFEVAMQKNGYKGTRMDQFKSYGLQALRENEYLFTNGSTYLLDKTGNPIVVNTRSSSGASKIPQTRVTPREVTGKVQ